MFAQRPSDDDVTAWALAARTGDRDAAASFIRATQADVVRFLTHLVSAGDAEDLAQETFLRAMRALPSFQGRSSARTWLLVIARRTAADHIRTLTRRPRLADAEDWVATADRGRVPRARFDEQHALWQLITALAVDRREAFILTQVLELSYAEAAEVCDCPVGTIRSRVARAREDLAEAMRDQDDNPARHLRAV
ncbi:RNA polymerase sigma-70 factor (ECF subfamily) [Allocatelliglobosispora scoriae]|uniref:RNA polymerase sigma factor n=1 Tax=Allocatelliglobosispora scoriae TaxID=643052 RepID=A0A841C210_9ACTN|nr:sigma-70 family RNA polymerase sigma factor [Allocatelliglobosispora scoriae]MBB5874384.1 RNA polymerase sigma-70 factor (ECF subfamily) [Allocatelliglobosispora scoriae]